MVALPIGIDHITLEKSMAPFHAMAESKHTGQTKNFMSLV